MKSIISLIFIAIPFLSVSQDLKGQWQGSYIINAYVEKLSLYVNSHDSDSVSVDATESNAFNLRYGITTKNDSLILTRINGKGTLIEFRGVVQDDSYTGRMVIHGKNKNVGLFQFMKSDNQLYKGEVIPDFSIITTSNETVTKDSFSSDYYMVDFWATWCKPCVAKRPKLEELKAQMGDELEIISISLDKEWATVEEFRKSKFPMPWRHAIEPKQWDSPFIQEFAPVGLPYGYLVDKYGKIIAVGEELNADKLVSTIKRVLL
ncbi:TlpA family protein disulfide reductase [Fulvivirga lutimaris]|uniref:TlpA family protein disulfide reductase n=1 Tax=Fulvivirga lutimaris TaxID=1819566 RepID=UPI0012BC4453|nr:TlpA disulfide reductase family protein [Fulvivirga lutimaris]MTI39378.1 TlpA family protein disulfide reductase [Fulvivirga lutimaris]